MIEVMDQSARRGAIVPLLDSVYKIIAANGTPMTHIITWKQKMSKNLVDINWRFIVAIEAGRLVGFLFYRYQGPNIYIEELHTAPDKKTDASIIQGLLAKLELDNGTKGAAFYINGRMQLAKREEMLAAVGLVPELENGWQCIGNLEEVKNEIKGRYLV